MRIVHRADHWLPWQAIETGSATVLACGTDEARLRADCRHCGWTVADA